MKQNTLTYAFVGIWETPIPQVPLLDRQFCMDFFGAPYSTTFGFTLNGFTIAKATNALHPDSVLIGLDRFEISVMKLEDMSGLIEKMKQKLIEVLGSGFNFRFINHGLNEELEILDLTIPSNEWISKTFLNSANFDRGISKVIGRIVNFDLQFSSGDTYNIYVEPRLNVENGLYIRINQGPLNGETNQILDEFHQLNENISSKIFSKLDLIFH